MKKQKLDKQTLEQIAKCMNTGKYVTTTEDNLALCTYYQKELCPQSEKQKDRNTYICKYWQHRIQW